MESRILRRLDYPWKLGLWELDVALTFSVCFMLGLIQGSASGMFIGTLAGYGLCVYITKSKAMRHIGYIWHMLYWFLPESIFPTKKAPASAQMDMVG